MAAEAHLACRRPLCIVQGHDHFLVMREGLPSTPYHQLAQVRVVPHGSGTPRDCFQLGVEHTALATLARHRGDAGEVLEAIYDFHAQQLAADRLLAGLIAPTYRGAMGQPDMYLIDPIKFRYGRIALVSSRDGAR